MVESKFLISKNEPKRDGSKICMLGSGCKNLSSYPLETIGVNKEKIGENWWKTGLTQNKKSGQSMIFSV